MELDFLKVEFHANFFISVIAPIFKEPYSGVFKPYSDILKSYSNVFLQKKFYKCDRPVVQGAL